MPYTAVEEIHTSEVRSYVVIQDGEFRTYFVDNVEGIVDEAVYRLNSDDTVINSYTL